MYSRVFWSQPQTSKVGVKKAEKIENTQGDEISQNQGKLNVDSRKLYLSEEFLDTAIAIFLLFSKISLMFWFENLVHFPSFFCA